MMKRVAHLSLCRESFVCWKKDIVLLREKHFGACKRTPFWLLELHVCHVTAKKEDPFLGSIWVVPRKMSFVPVLHKSCRIFVVQDGDIDGSSY